MRPLVLTGPTAAGKTSLALDLAERHGAIVVSMDAMQVYRGMDVGTGKVSLADRARVPHRCIDIREPDEPFSAADFAAEAEAAIATGRPVILCGGTPFYLRAFLVPLVEAPAVDPALRASLEALDNPHAALLEVDPVLASRLHPNDRVRLVRGLEYHALTGRRLSEVHDADAQSRRDAEVVWIDAPDLAQRIDRRVLSMIDEGYVAETERLLSRFSRDIKPLLSLGYRHMVAHVLDGLPLAEAVALTQRDTRRFARKQRSFFRSLGLEPGGDPALAAARAFAG